MKDTTRCVDCGRTLATPKQWKTLPGGARPDLCWRGDAECPAPRPALLRTCGDCGWHDYPMEGGSKPACLHPRGTDLADASQPPPDTCPLRGEP